MKAGDDKRHIVVPPQLIVDTRAESAADAAAFPTLSTMAQNHCPRRWNTHSNQQVCIRTPIFSGGAPPPVLRTRHFLHSIGQVPHHRAFPDFPRPDRLPTRFADLALRGATDLLFLPIGLGDDFGSAAPKSMPKTSTSFDESRIRPAPGSF